jgi:predicted 3-demethylubiquinone-9 3-methyltransferase (glyoxalase superfamily)
MPTITPFLWFDTQAEEAMNFYASVFKRSKVISVSRANGKVMSAQFELMNAMLAMDKLDLARLLQAYEGV